MRRLLVLGLTLLMAGSAMAQVDPDPDGIGLFFDGAYTNRCGSAASGMLPLYLVASNLSNGANGLAGWEAQVSFDGAGVMFLNALLAGQGPINLYTAPEFQVGLGLPMEAAPNLLLATINYFVMAPTPAYFRIHPIAHAQSIPGECIYADGIDVGDLRPFQHPQGVGPQGAWTLPAAILNAPCDVVAVEDDTWGGVKGMFK